MTSRNFAVAARPRPTPSGCTRSGPKLPTRSPPRWGVNVRKKNWPSGSAIRHGLDQHEAQLADARRTLAAQLAESLEKRGEMNEQLKRLVESRQLSHLRIELGIVEKRLTDALDRWRC